MKLATRIFALAYAALVLGLGVGGTLLLQNTFGNMLRDRQEALIARNENIHQTFAMLLAADEYLTTSLSGQFRRTLGAGEKVETVNRSGLDIPAGELISKIEQRDDGYFCVAASMMAPENGPAYYIVAEENISDVYALRRQSYTFFALFSCAFALLGGLLIAKSVKGIAAPITRLAQLETQFGSGELTLRASEKTGIWEARNLAHSFNTMAEQIEGQIHELQEENRRRDEFVGSFTHEIKTPITGIMGYADLMRSFELPPDERRDYCDTIFRESQRIEKLSLTLLQMLGLKQEAPPMQPFEATQLASSLAASLKPLFEKSELRLQIQALPAPLFGNESLLHTLLYNLADNGRKAMLDQPGVLVIEGRPEADEKRYRFTVRDAGRGIPREEIAKITEPFYMVDKSRARKQGGAGLGLALCKHIAALHHSQLDIESDVGVGTTVTFWVPLAGHEEGC